MKWLARLKSQNGPCTHPTEPTKPGFVGFVGSIPAGIEKTGGDPTASNDGQPDPDRWCYPVGDAMNTREIETFTARLVRFTDKGMGLEVAELVADKLVMRDRERDDRRLCLECDHLGRAGAWRCGNWQRAGVAIRSKDAQLPGGLVQALQHCDGFIGVTL